MNESKISVRYAKALFQTAVQQHCEDNVRTDMQDLLTCINGLQDFRVLLESPVISGDKKIETFKKMFGNKFSDLTIKFFEMLVKNKRENFLKVICLNFAGYYAQTKNIKQVQITAATNVPEKINNAVKSLVEKETPNCTVEISNVVNPDIVGGIVIKIDDVMYDASVKTQLAKFKSKIR